MYNSANNDDSRSPAEHPAAFDGYEAKAKPKGLGFGEPPSWLIPAKVFWSYTQATNQGFLSKSQWAQRKRQPIEDAPFVIVVRKSAKSGGWGIHPILEDLGEDIYLIATDYYYVIHKDNTVPIEPKVSRKSTTCAGLSSNDNSGESGNAIGVESQVFVSSSCISSSNQPSSSVPPSLPITSIDRKEVDENSIPVGKTRDFMIINRHESCVNKPCAFVPENFSREDEARLGDLAEEAYCVFHNMHLFRVIRRLPKDAWIDLNYDYFDRLLPHWRKLRPMLLDGILERTEVEEFPLLGIAVPRGVKGGKCYGYRFANEEYRNATVRKRPITDPKLIEMIEAHKNVKYPVQRWLEDNLQQIEMADIPDGKLLEVAEAEGEDDPQVRFYTYKEQVNLIRDKAWVFVADGFSRRIHTNLTQLKRELRAYLRVAGRPLVQLDIKNSQPLFIGQAAARKYGVEDRHYLEMCQGDLYQYLADQGGWTRAWSRIN